MHKNDYACPDANSILAFLLHLQYMEQIPFITPKETNALLSGKMRAKASSFSDAAIC
jgi:hypothetical protein